MFRYFYRYKIDLNHESFSLFFDACIMNELHDPVSLSTIFEPLLLGMVMEGNPLVYPQTWYNLILAYSKCQTEQGRHKAMAAFDQLKVLIPHWNSQQLYSSSHFDDVPVNILECMAYVYGSNMNIEQARSFFSIHVMHVARPSADLERIYESFVRGWLSESLDDVNLVKELVLNMRQNELVRME